MGTVVWAVFAVAAMVAIFAACTIAVVIGVRAIERSLARHRATRGIGTQ